MLNCWMKAKDSWTLCFGRTVAGFVRCCVGCAGFLQIEKNGRDQTWACHVFASVGVVKLLMDVVVVRMWYVRYLGWLGKFDPEAPDSENLLSFYCKMFYILWIYRYILSFIIHFSFQKQWGPDNSVDSNTCHCMGNAVAGSLCLFLMFLMFLFVCLSVSPFSSLRAAVNMHSKIWIWNKRKKEEDKKDHTFARSL